MTWTSTASNVFESSQLLQNDFHKVISSDVILTLLIIGSSFLKDFGESYVLAYDISKYFDMVFYVSDF